MRDLRLSSFALLSRVLLVPVSLVAGSALLSGWGCTDYNNNEPPVAIVPVGPPMEALHVVNNHLENGQGDTVVLRGVNRSGTEYQCVKGGGVFDGAWGLPAVAAIASWHVNAVRIPMNEACWLGLASNATPLSTSNYKQSISLFIQFLHQFHIVPILDLHWVGPGSGPADEQQPMPDADHAVDFWTDVANTFANDDGVVFDLYNEPFPDSNRDSDAAWQCWRDGCTATLWSGGRTTSSTYQAVGMQALVDAIRPVAPRNLLLLGGVEYSNSLSQWMTHAPADGNLAPSWHVYSFNPCRTETCWDGAPAAIAANLPIVATELGEDDCGGTFVEPFMQWLDGHNSGYLAWSWNSAPACMPTIRSATGQTTSSGRPWPLVTDYVSGTASGGYAQAFRDHLAGVVSPAANAAANPPASP